MVGSGEWLRASSGPLLIATGAALFACTNAASTAFYRRGGTIITVYLIRCVVVYVANGILAITSEGGFAAAWNVVTLRSGQRASSKWAFIRGLLGSAQSLGLNVSLVFVTFANAFTVFVGVSSVSTVLIARAALDSGERLSIPELSCGALTLAGVVLIAQPPLLFGASATQINSAALAVAALAGSLSAGFSVVTRVLAKTGGVHAAHLSPAMLLSHKLVVMFVFFAAFWLTGRLTGLAECGERG